MGKLNRHSKHRAMIVQNVVQYYVDINVEVLHQITYCVHTVDYRLGHAWIAFHVVRVTSQSKFYIQGYVMFTRVLRYVIGILINCLSRIFEDY